MNTEFTTLEQLYERLKPALRTKMREMRSLGYSYIREEDIWNYLKEVKWVSSKNLLLFEMVRDVLNVDNGSVDSYVRQKLNSRERRIYFN